MFNSESSSLSLPLFLLDDNIEQRDIDSPDFTIEIILDKTLLANLCQNPSVDENISINLEQYSLIEESDTEHQAQLILNHGPVLSAVVTIGEQLFISPPMDMMPTFNLGDEEESL